MKLHLHSTVSRFNPCRWTRDLWRPQSSTSSRVSTTSPLANLRSTLAAYIDDRNPARPCARANGSFAYPELRISYSRRHAQTVCPSRIRPTEPARASTPRASLGPNLFRDYLVEQLEHLDRDYDVTISVGRSTSEIPYPYVIENSGIEVGNVGTAELSRFFPSNELVHIGDEIADGVWNNARRRRLRPLALFDGPRTDFSLAGSNITRGRPPSISSISCCSRTMSAMWMNSLASRRCVAAQGRPLPRPVSTGWVYERGELTDAEAQIAAGPWRRHQMPAYHLMAEGGTGITLVNIGVGPSNAKTICDHVAVLRPHVWLMIGHCGGLRPSQKIGDYVLAHAYLRDDHVLDDVLPPEVPLPAIAEVQRALFEATTTITGEDEDSVKQRLRTGTVVTTDDRNWELRYAASALRFNQSRAVGIDMESRDRCRSGLPLPSTVRHPALRLRQAAARRAQASRSGERLLRTRN